VTGDVTDPIRTSNKYRRMDTDRSAWMDTDDRFYCTVERDGRLAVVDVVSMMMHDNMVVDGRWSMIDAGFHIKASHPTRRYTPTVLPSCWSSPSVLLSLSLVFLSEVFQNSHLLEYLEPLEVVVKGLLAHLLRFGNA
jgi:hypothetical protein